MRRDATAFQVTRRRFAFWVGLGLFNLAEAGGGTARRFGCGGHASHRHRSACAAESAHDARALDPGRE